MTSMLLTASRGDPGVPFPALTPSLLLGAVPHRVAPTLAFLGCRRVDLGPDDVTHRLDPVRYDVPLLAVPLLDQDGPAALVILAADLHGVREALHAELVHRRIGEVEVFEAPADLLAGQRLVAELPHRGADRLHGIHGV